MASDISSNEIRELLGYMKKIKQFEQRYELQIIAVERMMWGLLLIIAGIIDFVFAGYVFDYGPVFIPWMLIIPVGLLMSNFLSQRTKIFEEKKKKIAFYKQPINLAFVLIIAAIVAFSNRTLFFLVMPSIALIMGTAIFIDKLFLQKVSLPHNQQIVEYMTPFLVILTALVNLLGYFFITNINLDFLHIEYNSFSIFHGLIFGFVFGLMEILEAFLTRKMLLSMSKTK